MRIWVGEGGVEAHGGGGWGGGGGGLIGGVRCVGIGIVGGGRGLWGVVKEGPGVWGRRGGGWWGSVDWGSCALKGGAVGGGEWWGGGAEGVVGRGRWERHEVWIALGGAGRGEQRGGVVLG